MQGRTLGPGVFPAPMLISETIGAQMSIPARLSVYPAFRMGQIAKKTRATQRMSDDQRAACARDAAKLLRRKGPMPTAELLALLCAQGLSLTDALSVVNHGFAHQLLMRDPADAAGIGAGTASLPTPRRPTSRPPPPPAARKAPRRKAPARSDSRSA